MQVGLKDFANFGVDGNQVKTPRYPFRLSFVPQMHTTAAIPKFFDSGRPDDFTDILVDTLD